MSTRILLVDDNATNRKLAASVLALDGCIVDQACHAAQAEALLALALPDLILMDLAMPGTDGLTLTRRLRAQPRFRSVPIVALTASAMPSDRDDARAAGCDGLISKPIDTRAFPAQVRSFLNATPP